MPKQTWAKLYAVGQEGLSCSIERLHAWLAIHCMHELPCTTICACMGQFDHSAHDSPVTWSDPTNSLVSNHFSGAMGIYGSSLTGSEQALNIVHI
jgi:hypothetical protein